jgi:hypothetical protein
LHRPRAHQQAQSLASTGAWTRADLFALSSLSTRVVRSPVLLSGVPTLRWLQANQPNPTATHWFSELRVLNTPPWGFMLRAFASQNVSATATLKTSCSPYSCQVRISESALSVCTR